MKIFKFYRNDKNQEPIIVSAETYMEAANTVKELNNYAYKDYNLNDYKMECINVMPYLNIDEEYWCLPYILSKKQYNDIKEKLGINESDKKYNCTVLRNNMLHGNGECTMLNLLNKIDKYNDNDKNIKDREDFTILCNIKLALKNIIDKYVYSINNKETRNKIYSDIYTLIQKYDNMINKSLKEIKDEVL